MKNTLLKISAFKNVPRFLFGAIGIGMTSALLLLGLNYMSLGLGGSERIDEAFASHTLIGDYLAGDTVIGSHQFNDCLILGMAVDQSASVIDLTVSPRNPFFTSKDVCNSLQKHEYQHDNFYHNYLHGQTTLVRYLLPIMSVEDIRNLYRTMITLLLIAAIGTSMLRIAAGKMVREHSIFLIVLISFSRFFGLEMFGQSLGHGPADVVLIGYIVVLNLNVGGLSVRLAAIVAALFGSVTMIFELLTGGLPLGLAAVLGLSWFALKRAERSLLAVGTTVISYLAAAIAVSMTKLITVAIVFGPQTLLTIGRAAQQRVNGKLDAIYGDRSLLSSIVQNMDALASGLRSLSVGMVVIALAAGSWAMWRHRNRSEVLLLGLSLIPIIGWPFIFQQHMTIHAWFMDRIFVWPIAAGFALFALSIFYDHENRARSNRADKSNVIDVKNC